MTGESVDDPDNPGFQVSVRNLLIRNWQEGYGWTGHAIPPYLDENNQSIESLRKALAHLYVVFTADVEEIKKDPDLWEVPRSLYAVYKDMPAVLAPFANRFKNSDFDFIMNGLAEKPGLRKFAHFLENMEPKDYYVEETLSVEERRKELRKDLFGLLVRYTSVRAVTHLVNEYFNEETSEDHGFNEREIFNKDPEALAKHIDEKIHKTLKGVYTDAPAYIPYKAQKGAVYTLLYPLPRCLIVPRMGAANHNILTEKKADYLAKYAGQKFVEIPVPGKPARTVTEIQSVTSDVYMAVMSEDPELMHVPRCLLQPDFGSDKLEYLFGCSEGCENWRKRSGRLYYWHPYYSMWLEYGEVDRSYVSRLLEDNASTTTELEFQPIRFCPWCGAPLGEGQPYLVRGHLPVSRIVYDFEEDFLQIRSPQLKYHVDLWDRILQFYFRSEHASEQKLTLTDNYIFISDKVLRTESPQVSIEAIRDGLQVNGNYFNKQDLIFLSFVLYQTESAWERSLFFRDSAGSFGDVLEDDSN